MVNIGNTYSDRVLELRENSLTSLPRSMERLVSLTRIDLSQNQFTEVRRIYKDKLHILGSVQRMLKERELRDKAERDTGEG